MTDDIKAKIEAHKLWVQGKPGGTRADLGGAYLGGADLGGADLGGADLRGADLGGADLGGVRLSWRSHALISELLRREAGDDPDKRSLAGLIAISVDWCFDDWVPLIATHPLAGWAIETLRPWYRAGDEPAHQLRRIFGDPPATPDESDPAPEPQPEQA